MRHPAANRLREIELSEADAARLALIEQVISSRHFCHSPRLCDFLRYVADCALRGKPDDAVEQQIGIRVFQREPGYNSSEDSIVRSHARLLRQRLAAYFENEGQSEPLRIEMPKGHYMVVFRAQGVSPFGGETRGAREEQLRLPTLVHPAAAVSQAPESPAGLTSEVRSFRRPGWSGAVWALAGFVAGALVVAALAVALQPRLSSSVARLWRPFLSGDPPLVIYSNGLFVGDSKAGMRYATPAEIQDPGAEHLIDHYTGIGEVRGVYELTQLFQQAHAHFLLKRSHLLTWDEARQCNLIFIGSLAENLAVQALPTHGDFVLFSEGGTSGYRVNHPKPGEPQQVARPEQPLDHDFAVISFAPGVQPGKQVMLLSDLTTLGTEAAVNFATGPEGAAELLKAATDAGGTIRPFDALLETTVIGGVPTQTRLRLVHLH